MILKFSVQYVNISGLIQRVFFLHFIIILAVFNSHAQDFISEVTQIYIEKNTTLYIDDVWNVNQNSINNRKSKNSKLAPLKTTIPYERKYKVRHLSKPKRKSLEISNFIKFFLRPPPHLILNY